MGLPRFYAQGLSAGMLELDAAEARHASGARRLRVGDEVELFDGLGNFALGAMRQISSRQVIVECGSVMQDAAPVNCNTVAVAVPKGKRIQVMVEKLTELGIGVIQPVIFERSVSEGGDPESKWSRWAVEACKQCRRNWLPRIEPALKLEDFLGGCEDALLVADAEGERIEFDSGRNYACVIGPEGGLSAAELELCLKHGARKFRLGGHILRTETAAMAFAAVVGV